MTKDRYHTAYEQAKALLQRSDVEAVCERTGSLRTTGGLAVDYFHSRYEIILPEVSFAPDTLRRSDQVLILHYLTNTGTGEARGEYVTFKELPNAMFYDYAFRKRGPDRILGKYGDKPDALVEAAAHLGAQPAAAGDTSIQFSVLPRIEVQVVLYHGDEEFPPDVSMLFRDDIVRFLDLEDVAVLAGKIADRLS